MAHFAQLDEDNLVIQVVVTDNNDPNGDEGYTWLVENLGGTWVQTSYNATIRKNFAGIGFTYDPKLDAFIPPKPFPSWKLDTKTANWQAPVAYPTDGKIYDWNEETKTWQESALNGS